MFICSHVMTRRYKTTVDITCFFYFAAAIFAFLQRAWQWRLCGRKLQIRVKRFYELIKTKNHLKKSFKPSFYLLQYFIEYMEMARKKCMVILKTEGAKGQMKHITMMLSFLNSLRRAVKKLTESGETSQLIYNCNCNYQTLPVIKIWLIL